MLHGSFDPESAAKRIDAMVGFALADIYASAEQKGKIGEIVRIRECRPLSSRQAAHQHRPSTAQAGS